MGNKSTKVTNIFIAFSIAMFIAVCIIAFLREELLSTNGIVTSLLLIQIILGAFAINTAVLTTKKAYQMYLGLLLTGWGILLYLMHFVLPCNMYQMWPIFLILAAIMLIITGLFKYHSLKFGYTIPAVTLLCLGIWFMLFSFKVIKVSFRVVACVAGPAFMLAVGIFLVMFFLAQQKNKQLIVKDDGKNAFQDEELSLKK